jgi:hypothetical protein
LGTGTGVSSVCAVPAGAEGFYEGTITNTAARRATHVIAISGANGEGRVSGQDGTYYRLSLAQGDNILSGSFHGYSEGANFPNGAQSDAGSVAAVITQRGTRGTLTDQSGNAETLSLNFDNNYTLASSLPMLAGTWSFSVNGFSLIAALQMDGTLSAVDSNSCSYSGRGHQSAARSSSLMEVFARVWASTFLTMTAQYRE